MSISHKIELPLEKLARLKREAKAKQAKADSSCVEGTDIPEVIPAAVTTKTTLAEKLAKLQNMRSNSAAQIASIEKEEQALESLRERAREKVARLKRSTIDGKVGGNLDRTDTTIKLSMTKAMSGSGSAAPLGAGVTGDTYQLNKDEISFDQLNTEQLMAVKLAESGEDFCLIGSAGSGKTTTTRVIATVLHQSGIIGTLPEDTKVLKKGAPSILVVSFTNQAVRNIKEALPDEFKPHCLTIHKTLEYSPVYYQVDTDDGGTRTTMRFEPTRGIHNPINGVTHCIVEEAGSVSVELFDELRGALGRSCIFIFLGDLNQLPPVFGDAILGFKLLECPIVELKHTYRQDTDSNIKKLAMRILEGKAIGDVELETFNKPNELEIVKFKQRVSADRSIVQMGRHFQGLVRDGSFTPGVDQVLIPFGKAGTFGATELNKYIAQEDAVLREVETYEVLVGYVKEYFAVGDYVMSAKQKWRITKIEKNNLYLGASPQRPSIHLDRWGNNPDMVAATDQDLMTTEDMDAFFEAVGGAMSDDNAEKIQQCSHKITLACEDDEQVKTINSVGDVKDMVLAYAMTIHKSQGSEWQRVFCIFHESHAVMAQREILYTAITRARKFLRIYYSGERKATTGASFFQKGVINQKIKGNTLEHKLNYFRSKVKINAIKAQAAKKRAETGGLSSSNNVKWRKK